MRRFSAQAARRITRRRAAQGLLAGGAGLVAGQGRGDAPAGWPAQASLGPARPFSPDGLARLAAARAREPYRPALAPPDALLRAIDFDAFGRINYRAEHTLWGDLPGDHGVRLFPLGRPARTPVAMYVVAGDAARPVLYAPSLFDMPADSPARKLGAEAGFSGFRVMNGDHRTDWLAFLGASYFRSSDPFNQYGVSARGLALDTATASPEEFPDFTAFWLQAPGGDGLLIHALLEGPSVVGVYRMLHQRSAAGLVQDITATLHLRRPSARLGLAPLTSMYWYGQDDRTPADDWRPQVHDSDGLSIWTGSGERIWRPLANPPRVITNAFEGRSPRGFGLMQRDRAFGDYQDDGAFYDRRPSAWVEPVGDWGEGAVALVEIPTRGEGDDNIVAFWTPAAPVAPGQSLSLSYRLHWTDEEPAPLGVARVIATRSGLGGRPGQPPPPGRRKVVIDFEGGALAGTGPGDGVEPVVTTSVGRALDPVCYPVVGAGRWRLMFDLAAARGELVDVRAYLRRGTDALTETWIGQVFGD